MNNSKGLLIIVSGPAGVGKGTVLRRVFEKDKNLKLSVSATTRSPRNGEIDGINYYFVTKDEFKTMIENDKFLEYACYCDNYYGTPKDFVENIRNEGKDVVLEIEVEGAENVLKKCNDAISIFIAPPSPNELYERLKKRGTEPENIIEKRVNKAKYEIEMSKNYNYVIINDQVDTCADKLLDIISANRENI